jgi:uncharacterized protein
VDAELGVSAYWPWWAGALGLATVTVFYTLTTDRSLGLSGAWDRVLHWREEREIERMDEALADDDALAEALAQATAAEFGTVAARSGSLPAGPAHAAERRTEPEPAAPSRPAPLVTQAALIVSTVVGGLIAAVASGRFQLRIDMGEGFRQIVTANPIGMIVILFAGGVLVGFGTRLAGGCSSGHGLSGCGRLRPVSILATAVFFGTAVAVSFLLWKVI